LENVSTQYFFREERRFPWDWYDGVPKAGNTHSYLCSMLAHYAGMGQSFFFKANPSFRELKRFAKENGDLAKKIVDYCDFIYDKSDYDRENVAQEVLFFLGGFEPFRKDFQERINYLYRHGRISIPDQCKPSGG